jgi:hypothetical protein
MSIIEVKATGPLFDGRAVPITLRAERAIEFQIAEHGVNMIRGMLGASYVGPSTGYYQSQIRTDMSFEGTAIVDGMVVYGPWLEGVGSRNSPVTRFAGYHTFRRAGQKLNEEAGVMANVIIKPFIGELNA